MGRDNAQATRMRAAELLPKVATILGGRQGRTDDLSTARHGNSLNLNGENMPGVHLGTETSSVAEQFELLTAEELAERLRVPVSWIREQTRSRAMAADPLPHLRLGRYVRFQWGSPELEAWLRRRLFTKPVRGNVPRC